MPATPAGTGSRRGRGATAAGAPRTGRPGGPRSWPRAVRVFAREGFVDASVQAVAAEAGVAPTAVYYHFAGKEALFDAALGTVHEAINAVVVAGESRRRSG